jgi:hypothetical protein
MAKGNFQQGKNSSFSHSASSSSYANHGQHSGRGSPPLPESTSSSSRKGLQKGKGKGKNYETLPEEASMHFSRTEDIHLLSEGDYWRGNKVLEIRYGWTEDDFFHLDTRDREGDLSTTSAMNRGTFVKKEVEKECL